MSDVIHYKENDIIIEALSKLEENTINDIKALTDKLQKIREELEIQNANSKSTPKNALKNHSNLEYNKEWKRWQKAEYILKNELKKESKISEIIEVIRRYEGDLIVTHPYHATLSQKAEIGQIFYKKQNDQYEYTYGLIEWQEED